MFASIFCVAFLWATLTVAASNRYAQGRALISCYNIVLGLFFIYFALPSALLLALNGGAYVWIPWLGGNSEIAITALVCAISVAAFSLGYMPSFRRGQPFGDPLPMKRQELAALGMIVAGVALKIYAFNASGSLEQNLMRLSSGIRDTMEIDAVASHLIALKNLSGVADAGATWLLIERIRQRRHIAIWGVLFASILLLTYLSTGKRLYILWPILGAILATHYYVKPIQVRKAPVIVLAVLGLGFTTLMARIYLPAFMADVEIDLTTVEWANGSILKFYFFSLEFSTYEFLTLAIYESDQVVSFWGSRIEAFYVTNIEPLFYFVPRMLWPDKPLQFYDMSHAYRTVVMGGSLGDGGGIAATIVGTSWSLGGGMGMLATSIVLGMWCRRIDSTPGYRFNPSALSVCWYAYWIMVIFHFFRQGTIGWTGIIVVFQHSGMLLGLAALQTLRRTPVAGRNDGNGS